MTPTPTTRPPTHKPTGHLTRLTLALVPALTAATVLGAPPASAATDDGGSGTATRESAIVTHPERDTMGSTILAHEGRGAGEDRSAGRVRPLVTRTRGLDVSHWQGNIDWDGVHADGGRFAYAKATEGTSYRDPKFADNYLGAYYAGLKHGAYHFALPNVSSGARQANYFADHGGGWSPDGMTLPGTLDIEYNPYGGTCYGKSDAAMRNWIADFINTYHSRTGRWAVIYTTTDWWKTCTGNYGGFANHNPLWIARYASSPGELPNGWNFYTFWQYNDHGTFPGDQDYFNGAADRLLALCMG